MASAIFFVAPSTTFAAITWNNFIHDCPNVVSIASHSTQVNVGATGGCWGTSLSGVTPGQTIDIRLDYHNTGTSDAPNTILHLNDPSGISSPSFNFTGFVSSGATQLYNATPISLGLTSSQTLTFQSVVWYSDESLAGTTVSYGHDLISGSGLNIGTILSAASCPSTDTYCHRGAVVVSFLVGTTTPPPTTCAISSFTSDASSVNSGNGTNLRWVNTAGCSNITLTGGLWNNTPVSGNSINTGALTANTTYTLHATNAAGTSTDTKTLTVSVIPIIPPACTVTSFATSNGITTVTSGTSVTLNWITNGCSYVQITGGLINTTGNASGSLALGSLYSSATYSLVGHSSTGGVSATSTLPITVSSIVTPSVCTITSFTADSSSVTVNGSTTLRFVASSDCINITLTGGIYSNTPVSGPSVSSGIISAFTNFTLVAKNSDGSSTDTKYVAVNLATSGANCSVAGFSAANTSINSGSSTTLSWTTNNCASVFLTGGSYANTPVGLNTSITSGVLSTTTLFTLRAVGTNGFNSISYVTVNVNPVVTPNCSIGYFISNPSSATTGSSATLSWSVSNCTSVKISGGAWTNTPVSGTSISTGALSSTTSYHLVATGVNTVSSDVVVTVTSVYVPPVCSITFSAAPNAVTSGAASTLYWTTTSGCTGPLLLSGGIFSNTPVSGSSISTGALTNTTSYVLSSTGTSSDSKTLTVSVSSPSNPTCVINSFASSDSTIYTGSSTSLYWSTNGCTSVSLSGGTFSMYAYPLSINATSTGALATTTTYTLTATGTNTAVSHVTVTVTTAYVPPVVCSIGSFSASNPNINSGSSTTLYWSTTGCTSVTITGGTFYSTPVSGSSISTGALTNTTSYVLTASGTNTVTQPVTVYVTPVNTVTCSVNIYSSSSTITYGGYANINWNSTGCTSVNVSGNNLSSSNLSGSQSVGPIYGSYVYTINGYGTNTATQSVTVYSGTIDPNNSNTSPSVTTYAASNIGNNSANLNGYVSTTNNNYSTTYYFQYGTSQYGLGSQTTSQYISNGGNNVSTYVSGLSSNTTYYFRVVGSNSYGTNYGSVLSFVTTGQGNSNTGVSVVTSLATNVVAYSARLNGVVMGASGQGNIQVYFEYGTSQALGLQTSMLSVVGMSMNNYFDTIYTSPNTTYYYRIDAIVNGATYFGSTTSFTTPDSTLTDTPPTDTTTTNNHYTTNNYGGSGSGSDLVLLKITDNTDTVNSGDNVNYIVTYQNTSVYKLKNSTITVLLPNGFQFKQSSNGVYSNNNTIMYSIGDIAAGYQGMITISGVANGNISSNDMFMATATLAFNTRAAGQNSAVAYDVDNSSGFNAFGAFALFGAGFFPDTLLGWIFLIGLIIILILIARYYYHRSNEAAVASQTTTTTHYSVSHDAHSADGNDHLPH